MAVERLLPAIALFTCSYLRMSYFKEDLKYKYATKMKMPDIIQPITIFPQFGWGRTVFRAIVFATDGTACSNGFASKATNKTQQKPNRKQLRVYRNWRI